MTDLTEAARATRRYHIAHAIKHGSFPAWWVEDSSNGNLVAGPFTEILKAQAACDRLNAAAFLRTVREPSDGVIKAALDYLASTAEGSMSSLWRSMIDELIAEVRAR